MYTNFEPNEGCAEEHEILGVDLTFGVALCEGVIANIVC